MQVFQFKNKLRILSIVSSLSSISSFNCIYFLCNKLSDQCIPLAELTYEIEMNGVGGSKVLFKSPYEMKILDHFQEETFGSLSNK